MQSTWPKGPYSSALVSGMRPKHESRLQGRGPRLEKGEGEGATSQGDVSAKRLRASPTININWY